MSATAPTPQPTVNKMLTVLLCVAILMFITVLSIFFFGKIHASGLESWAVEYVKTGDAKDAKILEESKTGNSTRLCVETSIKGEETTWAITVRGEEAEAEPVEECA